VDLEPRPRKPDELLNVEKPGKKESEKRKKPERANTNTEKDPTG